MTTTKSSLVTAVGATCVGVIVLGLVLVAQQRNSGSRQALRGVWRNTQITYTGPNARTITAQPGLFILTDRHFSVVRVNNDTPRAVLPPPEQATDREFATALRAFTAFAGTYETSGDELRTSSTVDLNPNNMRPGFTRTFSYRIDGRTLQLVQKETSNGTIMTPTTFRYERVE